MVGRQYCDKIPPTPINKNMKRVNQMVSIILTWQTQGTLLIPALISMCMSCRAQVWWRSWLWEPWSHQCLKHFMAWQYTSMATLSDAHALSHSSDFLAGFFTLKKIVKCPHVITSNVTKGRLQHRPQMEMYILTRKTGMNYTSMLRCFEDSNMLLTPLRYSRGKSSFCTFGEFRLWHFQCP